MCLFWWVCHIFPPLISFGIPYKRSNTHMRAPIDTHINLYTHPRAQMDTHQWFHIFIYCAIPFIILVHKRISFALFLAFSFRRQFVFSASVCIGPKVHYPCMYSCVCLFLRVSLCVNFFSFSSRKFISSTCQIVAILKETVSWGL